VKDKKTCAFSIRKQIYIVQVRRHNEWHYFENLGSKFESKKEIFGSEFEKNLLDPKHWRKAVEKSLLQMWFGRLMRCTEYIIIKKDGRKSIHQTRGRVLVCSATWYTMLLPGIQLTHVPC
jgi:hypothetical protein